jgi:hypothetical protein
MRFSLLYWVLFCLSLVAPQANATSYFLTATLSPLPGVESSGFGFGEVDVSDDQTTAFATLFFSGLNGNVESGTGIYGPGQFGANVFSFIVPFPSSTSGSLSGSFELAPGDLQNLLNGQLYFTVYSDQFSGFGQIPFSVESGSALLSFDYTTILPELGGQIILTPEPAVAATLGLGLAAVAFVMRRSRSRVTKLGPKRFLAGPHVKTVKSHYRQA